MISGDRLVDLDPVEARDSEEDHAVVRRGRRSRRSVRRGRADDVRAARERPFAAWLVVAFFNPDLGPPSSGACFSSPWPRPRPRPISRSTSGSSGSWARSQPSSTSRAQPGSVTLLALHAATGAPQLASTSRHVTQGAIELEHVHWSEAERTLSGISLGPPQSAHDVFVYVPGQHPWTWERDTCTSATTKATA